MIFKIIGIVLVIILAIILLALCGLGIGLMIYVHYPKRPTYEETSAIEKSKDFVEDFESLPQKEMNIVMEDGYTLHGIFMQNDISTDKYVIVTHGYGYNRWGSIKYALIFYRLGFNVYLYDLRHFGNNKKTYCSMGVKESKDIIAIADYLREQFGKDIKIGLHGESLGAGSSILALGLDTNFEFCVADCPFSDLSLLFEQIMKAWFKLPAVLSHTGSIACKVFRGYRFDRIYPIKSFETNTTTPVCFFHGADDDFILPMHSERMYEACKAYKEIHIVQGANHAQSLQTDKKEYARIVEEFLKKIQMI